MVDMILAAGMRTPTEVWEGIRSFFTNFEWIVIFEAILCAAIVFVVFRTLWENNAKRFIIVYILMIATMGVITLFSRRFTVMGFFIFFLLLSLFFLLLFNVEIRRHIWNAGKHRTAKTASTANSAKMTAVAARADVYVTGIVKAVQNLSKSDIGALIVLSNGNLPREILESGVMLNAQISSQLIEGIFIPKAPLHDGAMIIYGDKIQAAGCFLPLTERDFPKDYGTRHRAGIGITEVADVSTIIVSEETGIVSIVKHGEITRYVDSEGLKRFLKEYYWKEFNAEEKA